MQHWVVERLADFGDLDVQAVVDFLEFNAGKLTQHFPALDAVLVTRLELDDVGLGAGLEFWLFIESLLGVLVKSLEVSDVWWLIHEIWEIVVKFCDEHTELGAPVTNMVNTVNLVAQKLKNAAD